MTVSKPMQPQKGLQIAMVVLLFAIVAAFATLIMLPSRLKASTEPPPEPERDYSIPRAAADGVNFLYGEAEDIATECFVVGDLTYIVGTTQSHAYDMTSELRGANNFVAVLTGGSVSRVKVFGTDADDTCVAAALGENELVVLAQSSADDMAVVLYEIDYTSLEITESVLRYPDRVRPVALLVDGATTIVAAQAESELDSNVLVYTLKNGSQQFLNTVDTTYAAYRYHALFRSPRGFELLATAYAGDDAYPVVVTLGTHFSIKPFLRGRGLSLRASYPIGSGYRVLLSAADGKSSVLAELDCATDSVTSERELAVAGEADLLPCGANGVAIAAYEANALLFVADNVRRTDLFDATLLASTPDENGEPLFVVANGSSLTLYGEAGKLREIAAARGDGSERDEVLGGRTQTRALFGDPDTVVFSARWTDTGANIAIATVAKAAA